MSTRKQGYTIYAWIFLFSVFHVFDFVCRLDINLCYWRLLGEGKVERSLNYEKYSLPPRDHLKHKSPGSKPDVKEVRDIEDGMPSAKSTDAAGSPDDEENADRRINEELLAQFITVLCSKPFTSAKDYSKAVGACRKQFHISPGKLDLQRSYTKLVAQGVISKNKYFEKLATKKSVRSQSGVLVVTVLTSPYPESNGKKGRFDCAYDCAYCPSEPVYRSKVFCGVF